VTYNPDFKITIIECQITRKWYNIQHIYNGRSIESRIWSIERRHFQWSWTTPYPRFQGHDVLWRLIYQKRYIHTRSFNGILIGTYTRHVQQSFRFSDLEWLCKIFNDTKRCAVSLRQLSLYFNAWRIAELKQRLLVEWRKLDHAIVVAPISQWLRHLSACVTAHGGCFEHILWCFQLFVVRCVKFMLRIFELGFDYFVYRQNVTCLKRFTWALRRWGGRHMPIIIGRLAIVS